LLLLKGEGCKKKQNNSTHHNNYFIKILKDRFTRFYQIGEKILNIFQTFLVLLKVI